MAEARSSVGFSRRACGQRREVREHLEQGRHLFLLIRTALELVVVAAEEFLGQLQHQGKVRLGHSEQRHDDAKRVVHGDFLHEVAFWADGDHLVHVRLGQFVDANLQRPHGLRTEPVRSNGPHHAVVGVVHVDQGADAHARLEFVGLRGDQHRPRRVGELRVRQLDVHDVGVPGDGPERPVPRYVDPRHRGVGTQVRQRPVQARLVGVCLGVGQSLRGVVHCRCTHLSLPSSSSRPVATCARSS
jgi:hypothetical protein